MFFEEEICNTIYDTGLFSLVYNETDFIKWDLIGVERFRLIYNCGDLYWIDGQRRMYATFETVLELVPLDIQTKLLFHLDLFRLGK